MQPPEASPPKERRAWARALDPLLWMAILVVALNHSLRMNLDTVDVDPDSAYSWAFNRHAASGGSWGSAFTFGPLGFLVGRFFHFGHQLHWKLAYQAVLSLWLVHVGRVVACAVVPPRRILLRAAAGLAVVSAVCTAGEYVLLLSFMAPVLVQVCHERQVRAGELAIMALLSSVAVLIKLQMGMGALLVALLASASSRDALPRRLRHVLLTLACFAIGCTALWKASGFPLRDLGFYGSAAFETVSGYSKAMANYYHPGVHGYLDGYATWKGLVGSYSIGLATFLAGVLLCRRGSRPALLALFIFPLYLVFKHSTTRLGDTHISHLPVLLKSLLVLSATVMLGGGAGSLSRRRRICAGLLMLAATVVTSQAASHYASGSRARIRGEVRGLLLPPLHLGFLDELRACCRMDELKARSERTHAELRERTRFSARLRDLIGGSSVDVYPWALHLVPLFDLNWRGSPAPVAFHVYTTKLDRLNEEHLLGPAGPELMIWHGHEYSIDDTHVLWAAPRTVRAILSGYRLIAEDEAGHRLLRRRSEGAIRDEGARASVERVGWNEWTSIPRVEGRRTFCHVRLHSPLALRIRELLLRQEPVTIELEYADGARAEYRFLPCNAEGGLLVYPFPRRAADLGALLAGELDDGPERMRFLSKAYGERRDRLELTWEPAR